MLTEVFLANGNPVIAIEPNGDMSAICLRLQTPSSSLTIVDATAEATTLPKHSIDLVAAGRAFHWFDRDRALAEFRRILKPDGWITLVSVGRAKDDSQQSTDFERLLVDYGTDYTYVRAGYRVHEDLHALFTRDWHHEEIHGKHRARRNRRDSHGRNVRRRPAQLPPWIQQHQPHQHQRRHHRRPIHPRNIRRVHIRRVFDFSRLGVLLRPNTMSLVP